MLSIRLGGFFMQEDMELGRQSVYIVQVLRPPGTKRSFYLRAILSSGKHTKWRKVQFNACMLCSQLPKALLILPSIGMSVQC